MESNIAAVLGRTPSGLYIATVQDGNGNETGMLASWVQQASFEPPAITVAVNKKRYLNDWLGATSKIALSLIGESQKEYLGHFGRGFEPDQPAFDGVETTKTPGGMSVLSGSLGWIEGEVSGQLDSGDHIVYLVQLTHGQPTEQIESEAPWVHLRRSGDKY